MRVLVAYESIYGNTHHVAEAIARSLGSAHEVELQPIGKTSMADLEAADLVFVGGPTQMHGESWEMTRSLAREESERNELDLDADAFGPGVRNWFHRMDDVDGIPAAAFDTRFNANPALTGRASKGIARKLRHHGFKVVAEPESFLVTTENTLVTGEETRAERWAKSVMARMPGKVSVDSR